MISNSLGFVPYDRIMATYTDEPYLVKRAYENGREAPCEQDKAKPQ